MMDTENIDDLVLTVASERWRKVAMVIALVAEKANNCHDDFYSLVAHRIAELVASGKLEAVGDVSQWRYSEIRKK